MHVHPESLPQHLLRLRGVERTAIIGTEEGKALDVIGGELRSEERVGLTRDNGNEGAGKDEHNGGGGKADETARP